jgi:hypothetical protein
MDQDGWRRDGGLKPALYRILLTPRSNPAESMDQLRADLSPAKSGNTTLSASIMAQEEGRNDRAPVTLPFE